MTRYICITGGKGGVGKTTTSVNLASALHKLGIDTVLVDANISTPNIHVHLGSEGIERSIHDAIAGDVHVLETIYKHSSGLRLVPALTDIHHLRYPDHDGFRDALMDLEGHAEIVIMDSAAGLGREAIVPMEVADDIILVSTPDHGSLEDAKNVIKVAREIKKQVLGIVLNMVRNDSYEHSADQVEAELGLPVIAIIPHDHKIRSAWKRKHPVVHIHPRSKSSKSFYKLTADLIGPAYVESVKKNKKSGKENKALETAGLKA
ncbi:MinD/ParA family protein [Nanoarchaeota archaeon]